MLLEGMNLKVLNKDRIKALLEKARFLEKKIRECNRIREGIYEILIESETSNQVYSIYIDLYRFIFICECYDYLMQNMDYPDMVVGSKKVYFCKHLMSSLVYIAKHKKEVLAEILLSKLERL
ncbi:MAG: hypothetical protein QXQ19_00415 [Candidatus Aenigmatarchaeota archaeon]